MPGTIFFYFLILLNEHWKASFMLNSCKFYLSTDAKNIQIELTYSQ